MVAHGFLGTTGKVQLCYGLPKWGDIFKAQAPKVRIFSDKKTFLGSRGGPVC